MNGSQVSGNTAPGGFGGGILNHGQMTIQASGVTGNTTPTDSSGDQGGGGGIANLNITPSPGPRTAGPDRQPAQSPATRQPGWAAASSRTA